MSSLSISLDLVAVMRAARGLSEPDPAQAAVLAEIAGADGIAVQFRRDKKYIRERDLYILKGIVKTRLAVEMAPSEDVIAKVLEIKPWMVIFAADHADSNTPMSPIDFDSSSVDFGDTVNAFSGVGVNTSFYIDPTTDAVKGAARAGAAAVLLNSAGYTGARTIEEAQQELDRIDRAAETARKSDLAVYCGRGVNYKNIRPLQELGNIDEFVVGQAINTRAMFVGLERAIREMKGLLLSEPART